MTGENQMTWGLIIDILEVLERHGHHPVDDLHTGQAVGVIRDLARVYEGSLDISYGTYRDQVPSPPGPAPGRPAPGPDRDVAVLTGTEISAVTAALDLAADYKRDRAGICADCADQSCPACHNRLQDAQAYDLLAVRMLRTAHAARTPDAGQAGPHHPGMTPGQDGPAAGREAGQ